MSILKGPTRYMRALIDSKKRILPLFLLSAIVVLILAACGNSSGSAPQSSFNPDKNSSLPHYASIPLKHAPIGYTRLSWNADNDELTVKITLTGLAPNSPHNAHIHAGTCPSNGAVIYPLNPLQANAQGDATSETVIKNVRNGIPTSGWYINVHNGVKMGSPLDERAISCGNVYHSDSSKKSRTIEITMNGTTAPNENADGHAILQVENGKPVLTITLNGLEPNSTHIAHIHSGSCAAQGPVVTKLNPVIANAQGIGTSKTTIDTAPSLQNGLYVNVHGAATMADLQQATLFNPIACGNVPLQGGY